MNIATRDFNLLLLFKILYEERKAVTAAEKLSISQPALSHRLAKLRIELNDPLFVRSSNGLMPTPKAHSIAPKVNRLINELENFYASGNEIDLQEIEDTVYLYTTDYMESVLLPRLLAIMGTFIPKVKLVTFNTRGKFPKHEIEMGGCDIAIAGFYHDLPSSFYQQKVKEEGFRVLANKNNNLIDGQLTLDNYLTCNHIVTTLNGNLDGIVDNALSKIGKKRNLVAGISSFLAPPVIVSESNLILTCLESIAINSIKQFPSLKSYPPPVSLPKVEVYQIWNQRTNNDPVRKLIRAKIFEVLSSTEVMD
ncbi:LysR family transcriptional regulator [Vibrio parahaemolyticus]|uniref:LysR family transcriptional regulator n=1 Tax=Vibrio parahaemolyticus TaxID=670 RepID=UPI00235F9CB6|nr:LysR family transcriptional regulator [Vibrio parahaemolyticus]HDU8574221.1 LysR family transcriptional regulator [Vibrio parahaemolyticus]